MREYTIMGMYDTFIDLERGRESQSKAFMCMLDTYTHEIDSNDVIYRNSRDNYRTYYVESLTEGYYIRIEGNLFTGIVSVNEDNIFAYPVLGYGGYKKDITLEEQGLQKQLIEYDEMIKEQSKHLPMNKLRDTTDRLRFHVDNYLAGRRNPKPESISYDVFGSVEL